MKLTSVFFGAVVGLGCMSSVMANQVMVMNSGQHVVQMKYKIAHHSPGHEVVLGQPQRLSLSGHAVHPIVFKLKGYQHAGVVLTAFKTPHGWYDIPGKETRFDSSTPGAWLSTDARHREKRLNCLEHLPSAPGRHDGSIRCSHP